MMSAAQWGEKLLRGSRLWLFLDYDGTLAPFAPTPDTLLPDSDLINLLRRLAAFPDHLRVVVLSGRRLQHIQTLLPVKGILLAGTYGVEYQSWDGELVRLLDFHQERPLLDQVKAGWQQMIGQRGDFYLEDKGYALALHGRRAEDREARKVLAEARAYAGQVAGLGAFRFLGGKKFLEIAPITADKGQSLLTLLKRFPWPGADLLYFGDDDKDEAAFKIVQQQRGWPVLVSAQERQTLARSRMSGPEDVRRWLSQLAEALEAGQG